MIYPYVFLAVIAGALLPVQIGINQSLRVGAGNPIIAALLSFLVGSLCLLAYAAVSRLSWPSTQILLRLPSWMWLGGAIGASYLAMSIYLAPRLGAANLMSIAIASQLFMSLALDHYGAIGFAQHSASSWRLCGALLMIVGCVLIVRN